MTLAGLEPLLWGRELLFAALPGWELSSTFPRHVHGSPVPGGKVQVCFPGWAGDSVF